MLRVNHKLLIKVCLFFSALFAYPASAFADKDVIYNSEQWVQYYNTSKLQNNYEFLFDTGFRWKQFFSEPSQYLFRAGLGYRASDTIRVSAGAAFMKAYDDGGQNRLEFRGYQQLTFNQATKLTFDLAHRFRLEERYLFYNSDTDEEDLASSFFVRFRYQFTMKFHLFDFSQRPDAVQCWLYLRDEVMFNFWREESSSIFDQNRVIIEPTLKINKGLTMALAWNSQYVNNVNSDNYLNKNIFWFRIRQTLDFSNK